MERPNDKLLLKKILTRYDQLGLIRNQIFEGKATSQAMAKLKRESQNKINEIDRELKKHYLQGPLSKLLKRYHLNKYQLVILFALLRQRLISSNPCLKGRELLQLLFDDTYGILKGMTFIDSSSILISTGIISPEITSEANEDLLETKFRLSDRVFNMIYNIFLPPAGREPKISTRGEGSYPNNLAFLMDLRKLSLLYQRRATKVFNYDYWDDIGIGVAESLEGINRQMELMREHIKARLERTDPTDRLFTWRFIKDFGLTEEETVILITLFFQEITEGNAYLNAVDLIRLTSQNEEDLIRKRTFFSSRHALVKHKLIQLEEMVNGKELTAEVCLPNWVIDKMLSGVGDGGNSIDADIRLDFHEYLKNLDSSEDFLEDLDA